MIGKCQQCGFQAGLYNIKDGLCPACRVIPADNISKKEWEKPKSSPLRTIVIIILGCIALGVLLMATGTPPGVVGFFIFLPVTVLLPILGVYFLISLLFKSNGSKDTDYNNSMEKDKIQRSDVKPTDRKVSCTRCYAFVPGDQPNCTSCGKSLR